MLHPLNKHPVGVRNTLSEQQIIEWEQSQEDGQGVNVSRYQRVSFIVNDRQIPKLIDFLPYIEVRHYFGRRRPPGSRPSSRASLETVPSPAARPPFPGS